LILSSTALTDGDLRLRPLEHADRDPMYEAVRESIAEISPWLPWCHTGYSPSETEAFIESCITAWAQQLHFPFGVFDAQSGRCLGGLGVRPLDRTNRICTIGYWVRTSETGKGIAPRAVRIAARFAFESLQFMRIEIVARVENRGSRRVAEKAGARFEVIARNRIAQHGQAYDAALYSLIPADLAS
jgi:RimJ/RimL family protein N-acetyltransferase